MQRRNSGTCLSPGLITFNTKTDLIYEIERFRFNCLAHDLNNSDATGVDRLCEYIVQWSAYLESDGANITRQWLTQNINPSQAGKVSSRRAAFTDDVKFISSFLQEAVENKEVASDLPIETEARYIAFTMYGYTAYFCMFDGISIADWGSNYASKVRERLMLLYPPQ